MTITQKLNNFPPVLVRLLARHRYGRPFTGSDIAVKSVFIPIQLVDSYSWRTDWETIPATHALGFLRGCGLDLDDAMAWRRTLGYLHHKPTFRYLRSSPGWERFYKPLLTHWRKSLGVVTTTSNMYPPLRDLAVRLTLLMHAK